MLEFGFLAFAQPMLLLALVILPLLWLLLRVTPPAPRRQRFPAIVLLTGLKPPQETSDKTPWWLVLLRNLAVACLILGLAHPLLSPDRQHSGSDPLALVIDDGWSAAHNWGQRMATGLRLIAQAERDDRPVFLVMTAPRKGEDRALTPLPATEARSLLRNHKPRPWPSRRADALARLEARDSPSRLNVVWLSDGLAEQGTSDQDRPLEDKAFAKALRRLGNLEIYRDPAGGSTKLLLPPETEGNDLMVRLERAQAGLGEVEEVLIIDSENQVLDSVALEFAPDDRIATAPITLPQQLRNRIAQLRLGREKSAGAVFLMDERWRRRPSGIATSSGTEDPQPLLSETYYLKRALEPFSDLQMDSLDELLDREISLLALPDGVGTLDGATEARLNDWIARGGVLVRFAGPRVAAKAEGPLPVALRGQDRVLGGSLTWDEPVHLAPFAPESPFAGLDAPDDILIRRQVLAEPSLELLQKTWATLSDGTPLVTAERRDNGWIVLFHVSSNTEWSNLPLSGLFVSMLRRLAEVGQGVVSRDDEVPLRPQALLDGFGALGGAGALSESVSLASLKETESVSSQRPPGYYGSEGLRVAHNLGGDLPPLEALPSFGAAVTESLYGSSEERPLGPWLLAAAMAMLLLDFLLSLWLRGHLGLRPAQGAGSGAAALLFAVLAAGSPGEARAQGDLEGAAPEDLKAIGATSITSLGYVVTDRSDVDSISAAGLAGLIRILHFRTSIEAGAPLPVDIERDELAFYPLLYWPVLTESEPLSPKASAKLQDFLDNGGTVLFDLRDPSATARITGQVGGPEAALRRLLEGLDVPPLAPIPPDHVLTKSFYLMQEFPGRFAGGQVWVEAEEGNDHDGVTSVVIGANDWASAWAVDGYGRPISTVVPGGDRQRELAYRFGVNLVMYALTGNYKADQVHIPYILERLGQ